METIFVIFGIHAMIIAICMYIGIIKAGEKLWKILESEENTTKSDMGKFIEEQEYCSVHYHWSGRKDFFLVVLKNRVTVLFKKYLKAILRTLINKNNLLPDSEINDKGIRKMSKKTSSETSFNKKDSSSTPAVEESKSLILKKIKKLDFLIHMKRKSKSLKV